MMVKEGSAPTLPYPYQLSINYHSTQLLYQANKTQKKNCMNRQMTVFS